MNVFTSMGIGCWYRGLFGLALVVNVFTFLSGLGGLDCCFMGFVRVLGCGRVTVFCLVGWNCFEVVEAG